eukprot:g1569.t1
MNFRERALALNGRAVSVDGTKGKVDMVGCIDERRFFAVVTLETGEACRYDNIKDVEKLLIPDPPSVSTSRRQSVNVSGEISPLVRSRKKLIALPPTGGTTEHHMLGVTGRWYPKELCFKTGDAVLSNWIDREYDPESAWPGEWICDQRRDVEGRIQYLVKFKKYELNPGVKDDESNPGDWYYKEDNVEDTLLRKWRRSRSCYGLGPMGDSDDDEVKSSSSSSFSDSDEEPNSYRKKLGKRKKNSSKKSTKSSGHKLTKYGP